MEGILMDYHLLFITLSFILFIITILLLFIDPTVEKTSAGLIIIMMNFVLCIFCSMSFYGLALTGQDSAGNVIYTHFYDMQTFSFIFIGLLYINVMLVIYCGYLFWKKPWEEFYQENKDMFEGGRINY